MKKFITLKLLLLLYLSGLVIYVVRSKSEYYIRYISIMSLIIIWLLLSQADFTFSTTASKAFG